MNSEERAEDGLPRLSTIVRDLKLSAVKSLGQNFLFDLNLTRRIARAAGSLAHYQIIEIGPGPGGLTRALFLEGARNIVAIEQDKRVLPALSDIANAYPGKLTVIAADALKIDWLNAISPPAKIIANLPFNIATALLVNWLSGPIWFESLTLLVQKEVAQRITAQTGTKAYGRLSILCQYHARVSRLFDIDRRAFIPSPKVTSSLVQLIPCQDNPAPCSVKILGQVTAAAFGQRRKMLRTSLKAVFPEPEKLLSSLNIDPHWRAEQLSVQNFIKLARALEYDLKTVSL